jgi:hypothetical protein
MAQAFVDGFETVEIDGQERKLRLIALGVLQCVPQQFAKQGAVGQAGQWITVDEDSEPQLGRRSSGIGWCG